MNTRSVMTMLLISTLAAGCAEMGVFGGGPTYGETGGAVVAEAERRGRVSAIETIKVHEDYKLGIGTAIGAVAGGLLGRELGGSEHRTTGTVVGAAVGAAAGTVAESKLRQKDAQRVTVEMETGGQVVIVQPVDNRLTRGMSVLVQGSGESARVVPR